MKSGLLARFWRKYRDDERVFRPGGMSRREILSVVNKGTAEPGSGEPEGSSSFLVVRWLYPLHSEPEHPS